METLCLGSEADLQAHSLVVLHLKNTNRNHPESIVLIEDEKTTLMAGPNFSTVDCIAAIELAGKVHIALHKSSGASLEIQALHHQLLSLESTLNAVKELQLELQFRGSRSAEVLSLQNTVVQCRQIINTFWEKMKRHQLSQMGGRSGITSDWRKVKLPYKKEDATRLGENLLDHMSSIQLALSNIRT